jgi:hypothetical protein
LLDRCLTSPESALLLADLYDAEYVVDKRFDRKLDVNEGIFGPVLHRESESLYEFNQLDIILDEYIQFDILKMYGLSIDKYMELTRYERSILTKKALDAMQKINEEAERLRRDKNNMMGDLDR